MNYEQLMELLIAILPAITAVLATLSTLVTIMVKIAQFKKEVSENIDQTELKKGIEALKNDFNQMTSSYNQLSSELAQTAARAEYYRKKAQRLYTTEEEDEKYGEPND